jgi:outer membrane lipoprotein-sorting protein
LSCSPCTPPEPNEAEKLFRQMEAKLANARTVEFQYETVVTYPGIPEPSKLKGSLSLAEGNKSRLEWHLKGLGVEETQLEITDGRKTWTSGKGFTPTKGEAPKWLNEAYRSAAARFALATGLSLHTGGEGLKEFKADDQFRLSDFKLGDREKVGDKEAQVIHYTVHPKGRKQETASESVWIDTETALPLKRVARFTTPWTGKMTMTETYTKLNLDGKIDPKQFQLPED